MFLSFVKSQQYFFQTARHLLHKYRNSLFLIATRRAHKTHFSVDFVEGGNNLNIKLSFSDPTPHNAK